MSAVLDTIQRCEDSIDQAHYTLERQGRLGEALNAYQGVEDELDKLGRMPFHAEYHELQRVLASCLLRQGSVLRQLGRAQQAVETAERELKAARASGDRLTLARGQLSYANAHLSGGDRQRGLHAIDEARRIFESGDRPEDRRGLGQYWLLRADLLNAGSVPGEASDALQATGNALAILEPLEDWAAVAHAYAARAQAHAALGNPQAAEADRAASKRYKRLAAQGKP
jgi:tetratricopeptide (TPR) repeat protein